MTDISWLTTFSKVCGALASLLGLYKARIGLSAWRERSRASRVQDALQGVRDIYQELHRACPPSDRLSVIKCHNGVGLPSPGRSAYSTVVYAVGLDPLQGRWNQVPTDAGAADILFHAMDGFTHYDAVNMPEGRMRLAVRAGKFTHTALTVIKTSKEGTWLLQQDSHTCLKRRQFELQTLANLLRDRLC